MSERIAKIVNDITTIDVDDWNRCANPPGVDYNPFLDHRFLYALEASGSVSNETGWQPFHVLLAEAEGESSGAPIGIVPMYLKSHSRGEYVFDGGWADAFYRAGGEYYPKLQVSVPFTPATGRRLLIADGVDAETAEHQLLSTAIEVANQISASSIHFTFMPESQWDRAAEFGFLKRMDSQYHWENAGFENFDEFLAALSSKKRKNIRRERRLALDNDIEIEWVTGDISEAHWDAFYTFYVDTGHRKWGTPYLNREFFSLIGELMPEQVLLIMCKRNNRYVAGAINFIGATTLFGRNWGCIEDHPFLHFETCYYQAIDFALANGLSRVEAGAQGAHKIARGYMPNATYSAHWIRDPRLKQAIEDYLERERAYVQEDIDYVEDHTPFRKDIDLKAYRDKLDAP